MIKDRFDLIFIVHIMLATSHNIGNVSGANQPLRASYENFNLSHWINIQGVWEIG